MLQFSTQNSSQGLIGNIRTLHQNSQSEHLSIADVFVYTVLFEHVKPVLGQNR